MSKTSNTTSLRHLMPVRRDPAAELKAAASNLEQFVSRKNVARFREVFLSIFSSKARAKVEHHRTSARNVVLKAIRTIKSHHLYIEKLKRGSEEERHLANAVLSAISQYHAAIDNAQQEVNWKVRVESFFYGSSVIEELRVHRIDLPTNPAYWLPIKQEESDERIRLAFQSQFHTAVEARRDPLLAQEGDALRMKASMLMKQHGIRFKSAADTLSSVHSAQIRATYDPTSRTSTLCLMLNVLPGAVIKVHGSFRRDTEEQSLPISDSFQLSFQNEQTGFPFPVQYNGWAFSGLLIPSFPHNLEHLPLFRPLYQRQRELALALLPNGPKVENAKQLLVLRKTILEENRIEFLKLHRELFRAILESAFEKQQRTEEANVQILEKFFDHLENDPKAIDHLAETFSLMNSYFVDAPWMKLQLAISEQHHSDLFSEDITVVQQTARMLLSEELDRVLTMLRSEKENPSSMLPNATIDFIICLGVALSPGFHAIMLQNSSETLHCAPPMLEDFAQMIQLGVYSQLHVFLDELDWNLESRSQEQWKDILLACMRQQMQDDIALFRSPSFDEANHPLILHVEELEDYFNTCFYSSLD